MTRVPIGATTSIRLSLAALLVIGSVARVAHAEVKIEGLSGELEANVRAHLRLDDEPCDAEPARVRYRFEQAETEIRAALKPFGYYQPEIGASLFTPEDDCWRAEFSVAPGEPVRVRKVQVEVRGEGAALPAFQRLIEKSEIRGGRRLNHRDYESLKQGLLVTAREFGFFDARLVASRIAVQLSERAADVELIMDTGPRYRFGELTLSGSDLSEGFLRRYVEFEPGAPFEQRRLRSLQNDLINSDYFTDVDVRTLPREDGTVDVELLLTPSRRVRYGIGVGYGTDTGPMLSADLVDRRFNALGHRLAFDAELSPVRQNVAADYRIPGQRPQRDWYSFYSGFNREASESIERQSWKLGARHNRFHTLRWNSTPFIEMLVERFRQDTDWASRTVLVPGWGLTYLRADDQSRPTRGLRLRGEVAGAAEKVLSSTSFLRFHLNGKAIVPVTRRGRLLLRAEAGWMFAGDFEQVPPTWRFFAGGDRSVRGYDYQSLGPEDAEGKAIGGKRLLTGSVESDWRFRERWSGAVFADAGNVGSGDLFADLPWSVGFGVRWYSPVGPLRIDLAFPQTGTTSVRLHISMGPDL